MKGILLLMGVLGVLFLFFWIVVVVLEKLFEGREGVLKGEKRGEEEIEAGIVTTIMAGVRAYEEEGDRRKRRYFKRKREEKFSWWRISRRIG